MVLVNVLSLLSPLILQRIVDDGITPKVGGVIASGVAMLLGTALLRALASFVQTYLGELVSQDVAFDLRNKIFGKLTNMSFSQFDQQQTGQMMTKVTNDVDTLRQFLGNGLLQLVGAFITLIVAAVLLLRINVQLGLIELASIPFMFAVLGVFLATARPLFTASQVALGKLNTVLQENLAGMRLVRAFAREPHETARYGTINEEYREINMQAARRISLTFPSLFLIINIATLAVLMVGGRQVIGGDIPLGQLVAFNSFLAALLQPVFQFGFLSAQVARAGVSAERIFDVLDSESEVKDRPNAKPLANVKGRVEFRDVSFRFAGAERNTLSNVSFVAEPGETIAILGRTGSGKSSVINLIPRFYDVRSGAVLIDGVDVRDYTLKSLRDALGIVLQDVVLFSGTLRDNLKYGAQNANDAQMIEAAKIAQAHDFIQQMPQGYDTVIGERGVGLSGGQKQRVSIARTLLSKPNILVFDDSTSSVDAETEYQIQQALDSLVKGRTSFIIAQRISTIRNADRILLIDDGRLVAQGKHEDLLRDDALYGEILDSQVLGIKKPDAIAPTAAMAGRGRPQMRASA